MEEFRRQFLLEAVERLENLSKDFQSADFSFASQKSEIFRTLHTIKGTAQTFGYQTSSHLAHQLETLLAVLKTETLSANDNYKPLFSEGIELLIESLKRKDFEIPHSFTEKIGVAVPNTPLLPNSFDNLSINIPSKFLSQLSAQEKNALRSALENKKNLFCLEAGFDLKSFADQLINLRESLGAFGEIIATLPGAKFDGGGKIGFQILLASSADTSEIRKVGEKSAAEIIFDSSRENDFSMDVPGVLAQIVEHGKALAEKLGKRIEFQTSAAEITLAPDKLKLVFDVLLHLIRNAVDHGFEKEGEIKIDLKAENNDLRLIFSDDGRGIDAEKIKLKAAAKNLIAADEILTAQEAINLIFLPEFSTKSGVTDISGRGIGLDAVKFAVEKNGGKITVESQNGKGATFEIRLPQ